MKIFSLQSKKSLVIWSIVLGVLANLVLIAIVYSPEPGQVYFDCENTKRHLSELTGPCPYHTAGWPISIDLYNAKDYGNPFLQYFGFLGIFNLIFWIAAFLMILNGVKYFKKINSPR